MFNKNRLIRILLLLCLPVSLISNASAEVLDKSAVFAGINVNYRVILPDNYNSQSSYPTILHFAGGGQTYDIVERSTDADWRQNAEERGYIVISPAATDGQLYFQEGARIFPEFIDYIFASYPVAGEKLHLTGHSNGGLSAFHVASLYPEYFLSLTGYPGLLNGASTERLEALRELCIYMHVGDRDPGWSGAMERQYLAMQGIGFNVQFQIEEDQIHRLDTSKAALGDRLFAGLERARQGCQR